LNYSNSYEKSALQKHNQQEEQNSKLAARKQEKQQDQQHQQLYQNQFTKYLAVELKHSCITAFSFEIKHPKLLTKRNSSYYPRSLHPQQ